MSNFPRVRFFRRTALVILAAASLTGCMTTPASAARQAQQMSDLGDALNDARNENAALAATVDSLRIVIAKHDTSLTRLANASGVQIVK